MRHKGIRPQYPIELDTSRGKRKRKTYYEDLPDGSHRIWNDRLLQSGCGKTIIYVHMEGDLIYCPYCNEWANINQFEEIEDDEATED